MSRENVIGQPVAKDVFDICDAICLQDARVIAMSRSAIETERGSR